MSSLSITLIVIAIFFALVQGLSALWHSMTNREALRKILDGKLEEARQLLEKE